MNTIHTVSEVNAMLKQKLDEESAFKNIFIRGEISNFTHHMKTGHFYFTLKDRNAAIRAIMFQWNTRHLRFLPQNGMNVILFGNIQLFERDGICQINCMDMQPDGLGALYLAYEQLKQKLEKQGVFDLSHKKPLPALPRRIGVVTSKNGAALQDICQILSRRYPIAELILIPALVQGEDAPASICEAISQAQNASLDVLIVGRGGGSLEDLWAFNDERVAWAIYHSRIPIISAVGHETDHTIADEVADLRAPTPSAAAELVAPSKQSLLDMLQDLQNRMDQSIQQIVIQQQQKYLQFAFALKKNSPENRLASVTERLHQLSARLNRQGSYILEQRHAELKKNVAALEAMNPLKVLLRGYSAVFLDKKVVSSVTQICPGDQLSIQFADGQAEVAVKNIIRKDTE
ncbi:MAG: exodeoxyribonuclease VII large subunit [Candidatus Merdivicinus sp.]|jgi:exodeoxyribonuclease VII large subunit